MSPPFVELDVGPQSRALGELLRTVRFLGRRESGPWRSPEAALGEKIHEPARATELGPRLAEGRAPLRSAELQRVGNRPWRCFLHRRGSCGAGGPRRFGGFPGPAP